MKIQLNILYQFIKELGSSDYDFEVVLSQKKGIPKTLITIPELGICEIDVSYIRCMEKVRKQYLKRRLTSILNN